MADRYNDLLRLLQDLDKKSNTDDDQAGLDENTAIDSFVPISDQATFSDTIATSLYTPSTFVWSDGIIAANWTWSLGGRWS
jgi:hypothetical protein